MRIRIIKAEEMGRVAVFMKAFEKETEFVTVDVGYATTRYEEMINSGVATVFVADQGDELLGALGLIKAPDLHNGEMMAIETFWFVAPEHRGIGLRLLDAFEEWAALNGCDKTAMIHLVDSMPERLERFYLKRGYSLVEKHYIKGIVSRTHY